MRPIGARTVGLLSSCGLIAVTGALGAVAPSAAIAAKHKVPVAARLHAVAVQRHSGRPPSSPPPGAFAGKGPSRKHLAIPLRVPDPAKLRGLKARAARGLAFGPQPG